MTSDQKQFWKTIKVLTHRKSTIPTLTLDNEVFSEDCDKARALNPLILDLIGVQCVCKHDYISGLDIYSSRYYKVKSHLHHGSMLTLYYDCQINLALKCKYKTDIYCEWFSAIMSRTYWMY